MKKHFLYILLFLLLSICSKGYPQGLQFYGNEKRISERSSFRVFTDENIPVPTGKFDISFEFATNNIESPGYILYLKNANGKEAFNLTYVYKHDKKHFTFAQDGKQIYHTAQYDNKKENGKWMPVSLQMDIANNRAEIKIGSHQATLEDIGLEGQKFTPQPFFGMCDYILETASFSIRNLTIGNGEKSWHFPLNENRGEDVHDSQGKVIGHITNPIWLINNSYHWNPVFQYYSITPSGLAFSPKSQRFHIYNRDSITSYDLNKQTSDKQAYNTTKNSRLHVRLGMNFPHESQDRIYAYELMPGETYIADMDPETADWKMIEESDRLVQLHHHCAIFLSQKHRFIFFGGYGNRHYYNDFLSYDLAQDRWDTLHFQGDPISPRFFASIALTPDQRHAYIYGGKGNETGNQDIGIQYYYDCYQLDFETLRIKKLWEHKAPQAHRVPARNMILSKDGKYLYQLGYPEYKPQSFLQLYRISVANGSYEALGDSIPMTSEEIATNANLYFNPERDEFYCAIQEFEKYGECTTRIYSLANPPVSWAATQCYDVLPNKQKDTSRLYIIALIIAIVSVSLFVILKRRKRLVPTPATSSPVAPASPHPVPVIEKAEEQETQDTVQEDIFLPNLPISNRKNSLSLFGTFTAMDKNGRDITYMFSPKIKHIFLYLLVNSITKDGVLSSDLNALFWPDKSDDKIKNLKNVTINHLRKVLQEMEGIELIHQQGYFKIQLMEECYCDYQHFLMLTGDMQQIPTAEGELKELYGIFAQGKFLHTIESSLFDYAKQTTETFVIHLLSEQIGCLYKNGKDKSTVYVCKMLFSIDPLSDTAMTYTVCTYRRQNKSDKAMQFYMTFCKEYRKVMGEDYPIVFEEVDVNHIRI